MIVLQDASLASVWEEIAGLRLVQSHHHLDRTWVDRRQHFWWRPGPPALSAVEGRTGMRRAGCHAFVSQPAGS